MPSLKRIIEKQLKENVPLSEIKRDLQMKGYDLESIDKNVRQVISKVDNKLQTHHLQIVVLIIGVAIAVGAGVYFYKGKISETGTSSTFCKPFTSTGTITCEKATELALSKYNGNIKNVFLFTGKDLGLAPELVNQTFWKFDVTLSKQVNFAGDTVGGDVEVIVNDNTGNVVLYKY